MTLLNIHDPNCLQYAKAIQCLVCDVDGVLTDGSLTFNDLGEETKTFNALDGQGLKFLLKNHMQVAIITSRQSAIVSQRMNELAIVHTYQGVKNKLSTLHTLANTLQLPLSAFAYVGDDFPDVLPMRAVGFAIAVANAHPFVKQSAHAVTKQTGGKGAVREICDILLAGHDIDFEDLLS